MTTPLPPVGTTALLEQLSGQVPDDFIAALFPRDSTGGRRHDLSAAQLWRVHLLALLTPTHSLNLLIAQLPEQSGWRRFARLRRGCPTARMHHEFRGHLGVRGLRRINQHLLGRLLRRHGVGPQAVALMDATDLPAACSGFKKNSAAYTAVRATLGGRTLKTGQSRWFVGYLGVESKQAGRTGWQTAVVTKLRADMKLVPPYVSATQAECPQGQALEWREHDPESGQQWFRAPAAAEYCPHCWNASRCPRCFGYAVGEHETLLGLIPLASRAAGRLLQQVRPWIEPAQSFEKNQLGLSQMFFNSLRLTWQMSLWADSAVLLRTLAWLDTPQNSPLLAGLQPQQLEFGLSSEIWP